MINFRNTWHLNEAETSRNDWWWEKIIRQMSRVLLGDWGAAPSRLSYTHSRWKWKAFVGSWRWSTYGCRESLFSSCFSGFGSITTSGQLMLTSNDLSVNPRQSWPCFSWGLKNVNLSFLTCHLFKSDLSVLSLFKNLIDFSSPLKGEKQKGEKAKHHLILCRKDFEDEDWIGR